MRKITRFFTRKKLIIRGRLYESENANQLRTINHALGSVRETKVLNRENYLINLFRGHVDKIEKHSFFIYFLSQTPRLFLEVTAVVAVSITAILFVLINLPNEQILPVISLLAVCTIRLIPAFNLIISSLSTRRFALASLKIVSEEFMNVPIDNKFGTQNLVEEKNYNSFFAKIFYFFYTFYKWNIMWLKIKFFCFVSRDICYYNKDLS